MHIESSFPFNLLFGIICAFVAHSRGRNAVGWFILGLIFYCVPLIGLLVLPDLVQEEQKHDHLRRENRRLREQVKKDRGVADARYEQSEARLTAHDRALGLDTAAYTPALAGGGPAAPFSELPAFEFEEAQWYFLDDERSRQGPYEFLAFKRLWRDATIGARTLVWCRSLNDWAPLGEVGGLEDELRA